MQAVARRHLPGVPVLALTATAAEKVPPASLEVQLHMLCLQPRHSALKWIPATGLEAAGGTKTSEVRQPVSTSPSALLHFLPSATTDDERRHMFPHSVSGGMWAQAQAGAA